MRTRILSLFHIYSLRHEILKIILQHLVAFVAPPTEFDYCPMVSIQGPCTLAWMVKGRRVRWNNLDFGQYSKL